MDAEAGGARDARELMADVTGAHDVELRGRFYGLDVHRHLSPANKTGLLGEIIGEIVFDEPWLAREQRFPCLPQRVVLIAAAADGAGHPSVRVHEHLRPNALRRGSLRRDDGDERHFFAALERLDELAQDFLAHTPILSDRPAKAGRRIT